MRTGLALLRWSAWTRHACQSSGHGIQIISDKNHHQYESWVMPVRETSYPAQDRLDCRQQWQTGEKIYI